MYKIYRGNTCFWLAGQYQLHLKYSSDMSLTTILNQCTTIVETALTPNTTTTNMEMHFVMC